MQDATIARRYPADRATRRIGQGGTIARVGLATAFVTITWLAATAIAQPYTPSSSYTTQPPYTPPTAYPQSTPYSQQSPYAPPAAYPPPSNQVIPASYAPTSTPAPTSNDGYTGRDFAGYVPPPSNSAPAVAPSYGTSGAPVTSTAANVYSAESWRSPLPSSRGVYSEDVLQASAGRRPFIPVDETVSLNGTGLSKEEREKRHFYTGLQDDFLYFFTGPPDEKIADQYYREGMDHYRAGRYGAAAWQFGWAAFRAPRKSQQAEESLYMEAESNFFDGDYAAAQKAYIDLLDTYDQPKRRDIVVRRLFAIARYWDELDRTVNVSPIHVADGRQPWIDTYGASQRCFEKIWTHDPLGDLADDSLMASGLSYMRKRRLDEAATNFQFLRQEHSDSDHLLDAFKYEILCRREMYMGPKYDGKSLDKAGKLIDQALTQFGSELGPDRDRLEKAKAEVKEAQAERDWAIAQYYDKKEFYGAARQYYETIPRDYPNTRYAEMAKNRQAEISGLPTEPEKFAWLTDFFLPDDTIRR